jgi:hypothetical protein
VVQDKIPQERHTADSDSTLKCVYCEQEFLGVKCERPICKTIFALEAKQSNKTECDRNVLRGKVYELSPKGQRKLVKLVGERCMVELMMDTRKYEVVWDTGAQVSLIGSQWLETHFAEKSVRAVKELFEMICV